MRIPSSLTTPKKSVYSNSMALAQYAARKSTAHAPHLFFLAAESMECLVAKVDAFLDGSKEPQTLSGAARAQQVGDLAKLPFRLADVYYDDEHMRQRLTEWRYYHIFIVGFFRSLTLCPHQSHPHPPSRVRHLG